MSTEPQKSFQELEREAGRQLLTSMIDTVSTENAKQLADAYLALNKAALLSKLNGLLTNEGIAELVDAIEKRKAANKVR